MDNKINKVAHEVPHLIINAATAQEHVAEVEQKLELSKSAIKASLPLSPSREFPRSCHLIHFSTMWLNAWPTKSSSGRWSLRELVAGTKLGMTHAKLPFGA